VLSVVLCLVMLYFGKQAMVGTVRLEDDEEDDMDERKDSQPPKYWPMQKPVHDKKPYLS